jgi:DNA-binding Lrp family transcriptional regulator
MVKMRNEIDELDMQILKLLRKDARLSLRKVASKLNVATGTVQSRLHRLEGEGIITSYHAHIDSRKLGYNISAIIGISIKKTEIGEFLTKLRKHKNVVGAYDVAGEFDSFIIVRFKTMDELDDFIKKEMISPPVERTTTFVVLETVKEGQTLFE